MAQPIEVRWEVMRQDEEWEDRDGTDWPPVVPDGTQKKQHTVYSLLLVTGLACILFVSLWTGSAAPESHATPESVAASASERAEPSIPQGIGYPKAPLEYWQEKFFQEEVEGRAYSKTPLDYWEEKFFQEEVEGR